MLMSTQWKVRVKWRGIYKPDKVLSLTSYNKSSSTNYVGMSYRSHIKLPLHSLNAEIWSMLPCQCTSVLCVISMAVHSRVFRDLCVRVCLLSSCSKKYCYYWRPAEECNTQFCQGNETKSLKIIIAALFYCMNLTSYSLYLRIFLFTYCAKRKSFKSHKLSYTHVI